MYHLAQNSLVIGRNVELLVVKCIRTNGSLYLLRLSMLWCEIPKPTLDTVTVLLAMSFEKYVRDLVYLRSGAFSDLVLKFGEKSWQTHKVLAVCHSKWFEKNLTCGMEVRFSDRISDLADLK
jgi:hypothetical protein